MTAIHENEYFDLNKIERLACLNLTLEAFNHLSKSLRDRFKRESIIPAVDIRGAIELIIQYPFLGGEKGSLKLLESQKALIGSTVYKEIKELIIGLSEMELHKRQEKSELEKNRKMREKEESLIKKVVTTSINEVWAIDFLYIKILGCLYTICVVYDPFNQGYLAIEVSETATAELAKSAVRKAIKYAKTKPKRFILSDNGKQFISLSYREFLDMLSVAPQTIPVGKPWYNGALESGNRDLRKVIYTVGIYLACKNTAITRPGSSRAVIHSFLQTCCQHAQRIINEEIVRKKFKTTPLKVAQDQVQEEQQKMNAFKVKKIIERKRRMKEFKKKRSRKSKTLEDKVRSQWKKIVRDLSFEKLFAFNELINSRYQIIQK
jgi:transposase InsO family protein